MTEDCDVPHEPHQDEPSIDAHLAETPVVSEQVFDGKLLHVRRDQVRLPDGSLATREYIVHPGAVLMLPVRDDGRLVVVRQYRYPHRRVFLEFPAGKLDPGEDALTTARRELIEEAGYTAARWTRLGVVHPVISYSTEAIELYLAEGLSHVGAKLDEGEFLEVLDLSVDEMLQRVDDGQITDAKTVAALLLYARRLGGRLPVVARQLTISGRVQGVGFRESLVAVASRERVVGWVRNMRDGTVEALLQGEEAALDRVLGWCRQGPPAARVLRVDVTSANVDRNLRGFARQPTF
ncbi:MAG: acylphosphatase [Pseudomonadota bacterium]|nr:acylphosphatase [Pseudomonadota bacterium]